MASVERPTRLQPPKASYYPRLLSSPGIRTEVVTDTRKEPPMLNRPCSLFGFQPKKLVDRSPSSPVTTPKKTPPPVPPRTSRTYSTPSPNAPRVVWTLGRDSTPDDAITPVAKEASPKKKTPPPVPKKPTHLRLLAHQRPVTPEASHVTTGRNDHLHMRLFALLLSPVTPTPISEAVKESDHADARMAKRHTRPLPAYESTPHLDRLLKDSNTVGDRIDFDDNNNSVNDGRKPSVDGKDQGGRRSALRQGRAARRKSLPLLAKNSNATTPTTDQSDGRSGVTSRCSSSFGAEQGSISTRDSRSSPPPPVPKKDYAQESGPSSSPICSKGIDFDYQGDHVGEEADSVVFFSTISTISSLAASRDRSLENGSLGEQRRENGSDKAHNNGRRCSRPAKATKASNALLNAFALEQNRRTVSIIERNARIIKWLYGCSKN